MTVHVYSPFGQTEGGRKIIFLKEDWRRRRVHSETSKSNWFLQETKKVSLFVKFRITPPLFCYWSDAITNRYIFSTKYPTKKQAKKYKRKMGQWIRDDKSAYIREDLAYNLICYIILGVI